MPIQKYIPCVAKRLPREKWVEAAANAVRINPDNAPAPHILTQAFPLTISRPEFIALNTTKRWSKYGVILTVGFLDNPTRDIINRILLHMNIWGTWANVKFKQTGINPQVRISRSTPAPNNGYWSYVGTDILSIAADQPTMNLEGFSSDTFEVEFCRVVRHETGHTLGFEHEHERSEIVNKIDKQKAISYFMQTEGWTEKEVTDQVLTPLFNSDLEATNIDPTSIMCYPLPAEIMTDGIDIPGGDDINQQDANWVAQIYPKLFQGRVSIVSTNFTKDDAHTNDTWQWLNEVSSMVLIKTSHTTSGFVEVHMDDYSSSKPTIFTEKEATSNGTWQMMTNLDLVFIKTSDTTNGFVEVHIASNSSNYQNRTIKETLFKVEDYSAIDDNSIWQLMPNLDLALLNADMYKSGNVYINVASNSSNYKEKTLEAAAFFFHENLQGTWQLMPNLDLALIKTFPTQNGYVEILIATHISNYQHFLINAPTSILLSATNDTYTWRLEDDVKNGLMLVYINSGNTFSGFVEVSKAFAIGTSN